MAVTILDNPKSSVIVVTSTKSAVNAITNPVAAKIIEVQKGLQGDQGIQGPVGPQGLQGLQGIQGVKGNTGATGATGPQGPQGIQGVIGPQGPTGNTGAQGPQGIQGPIGPSNLNFKGAWSSTYDYTNYDVVTYLGSSWYAVNNPPVGDVPNSSSAYWQIMSMKGDQGNTGPQGIQGIQGATGATGPQGPQGIQGLTGATGPQGPKGDPGTGNVNSVNSKLGPDIVLVPSDIGLGNVQNVDQTNGSNITSGTIAYARHPVGTVTNTLAAGDDARIVGAVQKANNLSDLASAATARTNLGLATVASTGSASNITTGTLPDGQLLARLKAVSTNNVVTDWNTATNNGWYSGTSAATNKPSGVTGNHYVNVMAYATTYVVQELFDVVNMALANSAGYIRFCVNGVWTGWTRQLATQDEMDSRYLTPAIAYSRLPIGTTSNTVAAGDDSRIVNSVQLTGDQIINGNKHFAGGLAISDQKIFIRDYSDGNHYIQFNSTTNGPRISGYGGGSLGTTQDGSTYTESMRWTVTGVTVNGVITGNGSGITNLNASYISTGILSIANGGTGSTTQNFVDLTTNQTIAGIKTFNNNIVTNGISTISDRQIRVRTITAPATNGDTSELGNVSFPNGAGLVKLDIIWGTPGISVTKNYIVPTQWAGTATDWRTVQPIQSSGPYSGYDFDLEASAASGVTTFRIRRVAGGATVGTVNARIELQSSTVGSYSWTDSTTTAAAPAATTGLWPYALNVRDASYITTGILGIANGGTGSATQNFVDLNTAQTVNGTKTFSESGLEGKVNLISSNASGRYILSIFNSPSMGGNLTLRSYGSGYSESFFGTAATGGSTILSQNSAGAGPLLVGTLSGNNIVIGTNNTARITIDGTGGNSVFTTGVTATSFGGDGSALTNLNAANIATGILPVARGGTGSTTQNFVDLSAAQTVGGIKSFSSYISLHQSVYNQPTVSTRSTGTRIVLNNSLSSSTTDYAIGVGTTANMWFSVTASASKFEWFAGTASIATLSGTGTLSVPYFSGNGSGITSLNSSNLSGTIPEASIPSRIGNLGQLISSTDLNTVLLTGFYRGSSMTNAPDASWWYVTVQGHDNNGSAGYCTQEATGYFGSTQGFKTYRRSLDGGTWSQWYQILKSSDYGVAGGVPQLDSGAKVAQANLVQNVQRIVFTSASQARPTGTTYVEWVGPVQPTNAIDGDTWVDNS